jgi:mediator of RNA polymerase II transcription subunit 31
MSDDLIQTIINDDRQRFLLDLEFVQTLANPQYLNFLAQRNYFKNPSFINYLKYLLYFKEDNYIKYVRYPQALYFLDLLQREQFRQELVNATYCRYIEDQQLLAWQRLQRRKSHLLNNAAGIPTTTANNNTNETETTSTQNNTNAISTSTTANNTQLR